MFRILIIIFVFVSANVLSKAEAQETKMRAHFIDVGQGDATLLEFDCGAVLIDTGGEYYRPDPQKPPVYDSTKKLTDYLDRFFKTRPNLNNRLESLILTHPHKDHTRGVPDILEKYLPRHIVHNGQKHGSGDGGQLDAMYYARQREKVDQWYVLERTTDNGLTNDIIDPLNCTAVDPKFIALWGQVSSDRGWYDDDYDNENNHSVVLRVEFGLASLLFTGDLEISEKGNRRAGIERLIREFRRGDLLDVDVYQVGHHGSFNGSSDELLSAMSPKIAILSHGPACERGRYSAWQFGHPRTKIVDMLERSVSGAREPVNGFMFDKHIGSYDKRSDYKPQRRQIEKAIYSTGWDGDIVLEANADGDWQAVSLSGAQTCR